MLVLLLIVGAVTPSPLLPRSLIFAIHNKYPNQQPRKFFLESAVARMVRAVEIRL